MTLSLTPNVTKAKIGEIVEFTVRVENTGTETIPGLFVSLGLPDALDARTEYCPFNPTSDITSCEIGDFAPLSIADVQFYVHVGSRTANRTVTAQASNNASGIIAFTEIAPIKILGPAKPH